MAILNMLPLPNTIIEGWVSARGTYMAAIHKEFDNRGFDYSAIGDKSGLSYKNKIKLSKNKIVIE